MQKRITLLLLLLFPVICKAQKFELSVNNGVFIGIGDVLDGDGGHAGSIKFFRNYKNFQIGGAVDVLAPTYGDLYLIPQVICNRFYKTKYGSIHTGVMAGYSAVPSFQGITGGIQVGTAIDFSKHFSFTVEPALRLVSDDFNPDYAEITVVQMLTVGLKYRF